MTPLLSVIIPTKNRYQYLAEVLEILHSINRHDIEIVVTDNSSDNQEFLGILERLNDNRIKYYYVDHNMSQTENSDFALSKASGEFVCFIGDDDVILESIFLMIDKMQSEQIDCIIQDPIDYYWPDVKFKYDLASQQPASFLFGSNYSPCFDTIDVTRELTHILATGATKIGRLPKVYHGVVRKSIMDEVKVKTGSYFPGPSPDMASSVALSLQSAKTVYSNLPFTISGKSGKSASGMGLTHTHIGDLRNKDFLPKNILETWNERLPQFWSCSTIWAQSAWTSINAAGNRAQINYSSLYANLLVFEPQYASLTKALIDKHCTLIEKLKISALRFKIFGFRVKSFIVRKYFSYNGMQTISGVNSLKECYEKVNKLLLENDFRGK